MTEGEMVKRYHGLDGCEFEQALGDGEAQGSLACCRPWGGKESDTTERLNSSSNNKVTESENTQSQGSNSRGSQSRL